MKGYKKMMGFLLAALTGVLCASGFLAACAEGEKGMTDEDAAALSRAFSASFAYTGSYTFGFSVETEAEASGMTLSGTEREICSFDAEDNTYYMYSYEDGTTGLLGTSLYSYDLYEAYVVRGEDGLYDCYLYRDTDGAVGRGVADERPEEDDLGQLTLAYLLASNENLDEFAGCATVGSLKQMCAALCGASASDVEATVSWSGKARVYTLSCSFIDASLSYETLYTYAYAFTVKDGLLSSMTADASYTDYTDPLSTGEVHEEMNVEYRYESSLAVARFSDLSLFRETAPV